MKIKYAQQYHFKQLREIEFDIFICSSGFETRSRHFFSKFSQEKPLKKVCFSFLDRKVLSKNENDEFFSSNEFIIYYFDNFSLHEVIELYTKIFAEFKKETINVLIDYSSMNKIMYAGLVKYFAIAGDAYSASIFFSYTPASYSEPALARSNLHNQPIPLFPTVELTDKKIALLAGLGYAEGKAHGLIEYLQIDNNDIYLFYTSKNTGESYFEKVKEHNNYILNKIPLQNQFQYELENVTQVFNLLESLCNYLISKSYRVIIAPLGPKVFSLISILLTLKYNDLTILRVSDGITGEPVDKLPTRDKEFIIINVNFINEDLNPEHSKQQLIA
jgi:hypothetical protein